jgi:hypothetical protein
LGSALETLAAGGRIPTTDTEILRKPYGKIDLARSLQGALMAARAAAKCSG